MKQSESDAIVGADASKRIRAIAYYRQSTDHQRANSITIQQNQVQEWANNNGVEIIHEFSDRNESGISSEERPAFTEMIEEWVTIDEKMMRANKKMANLLSLLLSVSSANYRLISDSSM